MKKVLIYFPEKNLLPQGGPAGYLYNLRKGLNCVENSNIEFHFYDNNNSDIIENKKLKDLIPNRIKDIRRAYKYSNYLENKALYDKSLLNYDAIHFHSTVDLYLNRDVLQDYKGKVILTSHTPCVSTKELIARLNVKDYKLLRKKIDRLIEIDEYAFKRADIIIFPCKDSEEPYFHTWPEYRKIRDEKKIKYLPTGIIKCSVKINREKFRKKYNIPKNAFVISYVGRHNEIKGYADLKIIGENILKDNNIYFLIAGKEGPLFKLNNSRWIELGWTDDPHSIINASDLFILPNKETFFDLILLEVMSLGIPVLLSDTGGNKYFKRFNCNGIMFYSSIQQAISIINKCITKDMKKYSDRICEIFNEEFIVDEFAKRYIEIIDSVV